MILLCAGLYAFLLMVAEGVLPQYLITKHFPGVYGGVEFCVFVFQFLPGIASIFGFLSVPCKPASTHPAEKQKGIEK